MNVHVCNENLQVDTNYIVNERFKNNHSSFEMLDWKTLEAFSDITARPNHPRCRNTRTTFSWQYSTATPVHSIIMGVPTRWESNEFEKVMTSFVFRADCTI